ncbi:MAG: TonB-dependent receptor [Proteobacteria bacterium]|jgi:iron complex outermembrane recepter protein|nr:TonB-dependent receptor [Pseudomonadota bacterium]
MPRLPSVLSPRTLALLSLLAISNIASGQTSNLQNDNLEEISIIGTRLPVSPASVLPNIAVLSSEQLERINHSHVQEALSRVPGVNMQRGSGQESLMAIRSPVLTGAGACGSFMISENNIPVRAAGFCNLNELFDAHTEQAARLEVLRGPGTVATGSNALTGGVNAYLGTDVDNAISVEVGSNQWVRAKARYATSDENGSLAAYFTSTHDGGFRDSSGFTQQKFSLRQQKNLSSGTLDSGLTIAYLDQQTAGFVVGENSYLSKQLSSQNVNPDAFRESLSVRAWSSYHVQRDNGVEWVITPFVRYTDMDFFLHFAPGTPLESNKQKSVGLQTALNWQPGEAFKISAGLDLDIANGSLLETQAEPTSGSAFLRATVPAGVHYDYEVNAVNVAAHISAQWQLANEWALSIGSRLEQQFYDYNNLAVSGRVREDGTTCGFGGCRFSRPADQSDRFTNLSPRVELSHALGMNSRFFAIASTFARAPQATELYRLQRAQVVADLDSEKSKSLELGFQWLTNDLALNVSLWGMKKTNVILRDSNFFNVADGETSHYGLEGSFTINPARNIEISGTLNFAQHEYRNNAAAGSEPIKGNEIDTAPGFFGDLRLLWKITETSELELQASNMGSYYMEPDNRFEYAGHTVYHLRGQMRIGDQWRAFARIVNVTDRRYADRADFTGFTGQRYFPGAPRSIFAGLEWRKE